MKGQEPHGCPADGEGCGIRHELGRTRLDEFAGDGARTPDGRNAVRPNCHPLVESRYPLLLVKQLRGDSLCRADDFCPDTGSQAVCVESPHERC